MKKILITGANGLLGQKLVSLLQEKKDFSFLATGRGESRLGDPSVSWKSMDITSKEEVVKVVEDYRPDVIIHTAAMTNVDQCEQDQEGCIKQNINATQYITEAAEKVNAFLLHLSTDFIFDGTKGPLTEDEVPNPISFYGHSKLEAEKIVMKSKVRWAIARTVLVFGIVKDMSRSNIILWVKKSLEDKKQINVVDDQWRTPTLAEDLAMGCYLIAKKEAEGVFNISGEEMLTPYDMAMATVDFFKLDPQYITRSDSTLFTQPAKRPPRTGFIIDKAKRELGYKPHSFKEGIALLKEQLG